MQYIIVISIILILTIFSIIISNIKQRKRRIKQIRENFGAKPALKKYDFETLSLHWNEHQSHVAEDEKIDDITWSDLDMNQVFIRVNACNSFVGEQVLYSRMHCTPKQMHPIESFEEKIRFFDSHDAIREQTQLLLDKLAFNHNSYTMPKYIAKLNQYRIKGIWMYRMMQGLLGLSILPAIILKDIGLMVIFLGVFAINLLIYVRGKSKHEVDLDMLSNILKVMKTGKLLTNRQKYGFPAKFHDLENLSQSFGNISKAVELLHAKKEAAIYGDIFGLIQDYLVGATLWDFIKYDQIIGMLENKKATFMKIFMEVGELDAAISVVSYRKSLQMYCAPTFTTQKDVTVDEIYHPLIDEPVYNSVHLDSNCIITGSNASGKSTFIKSVALNLILGQSINTCTASKMIMPLTRVVTSMAVRDDLMSGESYYIKEIKYLNRIILSLDKNRFLVCVIDEILRGTNTEERIAASASILEYLDKSHCLAIVASHDIELTNLLKEQYTNYYFKETMMGRDVTFDYKINNGSAVSKNAIKLLEIVGFPESIVARAQILAKMSDGDATVLDNI